MKFRRMKDMDRPFKKLNHIEVINKRKRSGQIIEI